MKEKTLFPREEKSEILFKKISEDKWACEKLMETFCSYLFSNDGVDLPDNPSAVEFTQALFNSYRNRDLSAFLMAICQNTVFDLLRNAFLIPYRFNADGKQNPIIMTDENGVLLPKYKNLFMNGNTVIFMKFIWISDLQRIFSRTGVPLQSFLYIR